MRKNKKPVMMTPGPLVTMFNQSHDLDADGCSHEVHLKIESFIKGEIEEDDEVTVVSRPEMLDSLFIGVGINPRRPGESARIAKGTGKIR